MALPGYLEDTAKDYAKQATAAYSVYRLIQVNLPVQQFVAGEDPLQTSAINLAHLRSRILHSLFIKQLKQDLTQAGTDVGAARTAAGGLGALTGPTAYQPFMSPYQQDVIDASLGEFDQTSSTDNNNKLEDAISLEYQGAFGGGREGVQQAEYQTGQRIEIERCFKQGLLQQGYGNAQAAAQQAFANQQAIAARSTRIRNKPNKGLGREQMNLSNFQRAGLGADVGALGQLGSLRQGLTQAQLTAQSTSSADCSL